MHPLSSQGIWRFSLTNFIIISLLTISLPLLPTHAKEKGSWWKRNITRTVESAAQTVGNSVGDVVETQIKALQTVGNVLEAATNVAEGDNNSAKKAWQRAGNNLADAAQSADRVVDQAVNTAIDLSLDAPTHSVTELYDEVAGGHDGRDAYHQAKERANKNVNKELAQAVKKIGNAVEVATKPENLGKIALLYVASTVAGPFGAALANAMYDKYVLKIPMTDRQLLQSFVVGAAAGYVAGQIPGVTQADFPDYLSRTLSTVTYNVTKTTGDCVANVANTDQCRAKDFLVALATAATASIEMGDGLIANTFEAGMNAGMGNVATQAIDNGGFKNLDLERVEQVALQGAAEGMTRDVVHESLDQAAQLLPESVREAQRLDLQAAEAMGDFFSEIFTSAQDGQLPAGESLVEKTFKELPAAEQQQLAASIIDANAEIVESIAEELFGKSFSELSEEERNSNEFQRAHYHAMAQWGASEAQRNPAWLDLMIAQAAESGELVVIDKNTPLLAEAAPVLPPGAVRPALSVISGGAGASASASAATSATTIWQTAAPLVIQAVKRIGPWIPLLYPEKVGEGSDQVPVPLPIPLPPNLPPPSSDDNEGQALYRRAKEGDRAALVRYVQREVKKIEGQKADNPGVKSGTTVANGESAANRALHEKYVAELKRLVNGSFPKDPQEITKILGVEPKVTPRTDGTVKMTWKANKNTRIRYEKHPPKQEEISINPRHHEDHYHVETKPDNLTWNQAEKQGLVKKQAPVDYTRGDGTGLLPGEGFPGE